MGDSRLAGLAPLVLTLAALPAAAQGPTWIHQLGTIAEEDICAAAPDGSGGAYVGGYTFGHLGGPNAGHTDIWLARYDAAGNQPWIRQFGAARYDYGYAAPSDGPGGVYLCGRTYGSLGGPSAGYYDPWVARFDGAGNQTWIRQLGTSSIWGDHAWAAASDGWGGVYIAGHAFDSLGGAYQGEADVWLARCDKLGNQLGIDQIGTVDNDWALAAGPDGSGCVYNGGNTDGSLGGPYMGLGDVWLARYDSCLSPATYCTAKVNSLGCTPAISWTGSPSSSHATTLRIRGGNVLNSSPGMLIYSKTGPDALPFQGGFLCLQAPIKRTTLQRSGGKPPPKDCSGLFAFEFNDYIASGSDPALIAGQPVWAQYWHRDTGSPSGTGLTDGLHLTICP